MTALLALVTIALKAWVAWVQLQISTSLDKDEEEVFKLSANPDSADLLRIEFLEHRIARKRESQRAL